MVIGSVLIRVLLTRRRFNSASVEWVECSILMDGTNFEVDQQFHIIINYTKTVSERALDSRHCPTAWGKADRLCYKIPINIDRPCRVPSLK